MMINMMLTPLQLIFDKFNSFKYSLINKKVQTKQRSREFQKKINKKFGDILIVNYNYLYY